ncbi:MAG: hypothetical protein Q9222_001560 [Ikaeria aurantiellina]
MRAFQLLKVSESNKSPLFRAASENLPEIHQKSRAILKRLQDFYPPSLQLFGLKDTAISQAPLRLLFEQSTQYELSGSSWIKSYIALSYCWHSDEWTPADGLGSLQDDWPISSTMVLGFLSQRQNANEGLWIDTFCINQEDGREKSEVIGSMDLIYRSARKVVAVLEDISVDAKEKELMDEGKAFSDEHLRKTDKRSLRTLTAIFIRILSARWFKRAWCSHELQLGAVSTFLIPAGETYMELSAESLEVLHARTCDYHLVDDDLASLLRNCFRSYVFCSRVWEASKGQTAGR